ncbi:MAG: D-glycero-beta-D-manno-heptose 1,7-bisphosphate 7-phosphatase [Formivibrio sp.]|nr:D-glycero-beta-D-manno-heptose 1,7-bisphosphate 7-phosphatase [Formivibrio sp.]
MKLLVLDRDGVINEDSPDFIKTPEEWQAIPGSLDAISALYRAGWSIVVASNQSAIGRGMITVETLNRIHAKMHRAVANAGGHIDAVFFCPHEPGDHCDCRKPKPGLLHEIARRYHILPMHMIMVGDSKRDLEAVAALDGLPILVRTGKGAATEEAGSLPANTLTFNNLAAVAAFLLAREGEKG